MTSRYDPEEPQKFHSLSYQALHTLVAAFTLILRAAAVPFAVSVAAVVVARLVGPPDRYVLDGVHGLMVISYLTSLTRIMRCSHPGFGVFGLAVPRPSLADWPGVRAMFGMMAEALLLMLPAAFIMFLLALNIGPFFMGIESLILSVVGIILPEFVLNTLLGLVIGAGMAKAAAERT